MTPHQFVENYQKMFCHQTGQTPAYGKETKKNTTVKNTVVLFFVLFISIAGRIMTSIQLPEQSTSAVADVIIALR